MNEGPAGDHKGAREEQQPFRIADQEEAMISSNEQEAKECLPKTIDCFLFFQELDLLEIRLKYLNEAVDTFVIVEACQTFTGKHKNFMFELNQQRYKEYLGKIKYFKIEDKHFTYRSVTEHLNGRAMNSATSKVREWMESHKHYDKTILHYVLDTYHRECIHVALEELGATDKDIVMISDLDEIPSLKAISKAKMSICQGKPVVLKQKEFSYFLDYYKNSDWLGTIVGTYSQIKERSMNDFRIDSKASRKLVGKEPIETGGYHFTTCGSIEEIKYKIDSWAHQEFNNGFVLDTLQDKIKRGQDPFSRSSGTIFRRTSLYDNNIYDKNMQGIIEQFPLLLSPEEIVHVHNSRIINLVNKLRLYVPRIIDQFAKSINRIKGNITQ
jgi:beta-1,4-mannosyl-glycoprotein beta-1,4-N-acetylglucosaminyltransferase